MENSTQSAQKTGIERALLRKYYLENEFCLSIEGILKILSIAVCMILSMTLMWGGWCGAGAGAGAGAAAGGAALGAGALLAALSAANALLAARAPLTCFITDMVMSTVIGVSLLLVAIFSISLCQMPRIIDYIYGPLALINSMLVIGSAVVTYMSVSKKWDAVLGTRNNQGSPDSNDLEV
ncbi:unnamed protein product [Euphydryas editha]|uniref:MARVEL domain-containing protein n=1 Tax=Euphydryas editha TaxID=104508 RepID=A0AAU9TS19_EUPED|nr:unnamed protein product [Euphydryas editha]